MVSPRNLLLQISSQPTLEGFLPQWRHALRNRETSERTFWEGSYAYADLKKTGCLDRVRLEEKADQDGSFEGGLAAPIPSHAVPKICVALKTYKRDLKRVRDLINTEKDREDWLYKQADVFRKRAERVAGGDPSLARNLTSIARRIDEARRGARSRLARRWELNLGFILPIKGHDKVQQARQIDSQFQVRLGAILRTFMPRDPVPSEKEMRGPSLRTIARLIILFLVCSELAEVKGGEVRLLHNNRKVTVNGVLQQLRAGIDL
jgi:hypothetical protein